MMTDDQCGVLDFLSRHFLSVNSCTCVVLNSRRSSSIFQPASARYYLEIAFIISMCATGFIYVDNNGVGVSSEILS